MRELTPRSADEGGRAGVVALVGVESSEFKDATKDLRWEESIAAMFLGRRGRKATMVDLSAQPFCPARFTGAIHKDFAPVLPNFTLLGLSSC